MKQVYVVKFCDLLIKCFCQIKQNFMPSILFSFIAVSQLSTSEVKAVWHDCCFLNPDLW